MATKEEILEDCKKIVQDRAYDWAMNNVHQTTNYDHFFDMLLEETEDRPTIPSYFAVKFGRKSWEDLAICDFITLLDRALEYEELYEEYLKETRVLLEKFYPENAKIKRLLEIYDEFASLPEEERGDSPIMRKLEDEDAVLGRLF